MNPSYDITGTVGGDKFRALVTADKKNNSIHVHYYGKEPQSKKTPIQVKQSNGKFPEGNGAELAKLVLDDHFSGKEVQIGSVKDGKESAAQSGQPVRIIVRYRK